MLFLLLFLSFASAQMEYDILIRNAKIIDGTGALWLRGDLAVRDGVITNIGSLPINATGTETIDVGGRSYIAPGFIDSHTHDDVAILESPSHEFKVVQGVTTVITGNCGFSNFPEGHLSLTQDHLRSLLGDVSEESFFKDFEALKETLTKKKVGLNAGALVGHGPLRLAVVGYDNRNASQEEIQKMCELLDTQLAQGALGLSLGLVYPPSSYANLEELVSLAKIVRKYNRVITAHVRSYEGGLLKSVEEFVEVLRQSGARGLMSHLQAAGTPYWNSSIPQALSLLETARSKGIDIAVDMYPYLAGSSTILQLLPPSSMSGGIDTLLGNMANATYLTYLKNMTEGGKEPGWESKVALIGYSNIVIGSVVDEALKEFEGLTIPEGALNLQTTEFEFLTHVIKVDRGMTNVIMFQQSQDDNYMTFQSHLQMVGSDSIPRSGSGGKPHPRGFGSFPRVIGRYAKGDGVMGIEEAVRKCTSATANRFGIFDRGVLRVGMKADLVLFNDEIMDEATFENPTLSPKGIEGVWVNGVRVVGEKGGLIGGHILPGEILVGGNNDPPNKPNTAWKMTTNSLFQLLLFSLFLSFLI